ncbi:hypothetical protein [Caminibacter sp.]
MRYFYTLFIFLLFTGCASKVCGIDEKVFATFPKPKQEAICQTYAKAAGEAELLRQKRLLLEEENHKRELELELKKVNCLYTPKPNDPYAATQVLNIRVVSGQVCEGKHCYTIIPLEFSIARGEVRQVCFDRFCFWMTYQGGELLINVEPDWDKRRFGRYVGREGDFYITKQSVRLRPHDWFRGEYRHLRFKKERHSYKLRIYLRYR